MIAKYKDELLRLPDIFLVGAAKSGTTTVSSILDRHPNIAVPIKEPSFFSSTNLPADNLDTVNRKRHINTIEEYVKLYENQKEGQLLADCSVMYLIAYENTINNLKRIYGELYRKLKIIIILRNPIDRAYSHYNMLLRNGIETLPFEEAILQENYERRRHLRRGFDYLGNGLYFKQVKAFLESFDDVKIFLYENLQDINNLSKDLFNHVGVEPLESIDAATILNPSGKPKYKWLIQLLRKDNYFKRILKSKLFERYRHNFIKIKSLLIKFSVKKDPMSHEIRNNLKEYYRSDIEDLQSLIGRDLSHWLND